MRQRFGAAVARLTMKLMAVEELSAGLEPVRGERAGGRPAVPGAEGLRRWPR